MLTLPPCTFDKTPLLPVLQEDQQQPKKDGTPKRRHTYKLFPSSPPAQIISPVYGVDVLRGDIQARDYTVVLPRLREAQNHNSFNTTLPSSEENNNNNIAVKRGNGIQGTTGEETTDADLKIPCDKTVKQGTHRETRPANQDYYSRVSNTRYCLGTRTR